MYRFIKPKLVQCKSGTELAHTDVIKVDNQLPDGNLNIGVKARRYLKNLSITTERMYSLNETVLQSPENIYKSDCHTKTLN
jgi:hypothetical protein